MAPPAAFRSQPPRARCGSPGSMWSSPRNGPAPDETERGIAWARETFASLAPYLRPTRYVNYLEDDATDAATVAYGPNLPRLREIKTKYDPENFFRQNVNILPA